MTADPVGGATLEIMDQAKNYNACLFELIRPFLKGNVAEVGAGTGTFTRRLVSAGLKVTAIDINSDYLARIKESCREVKTYRVDLQEKTLPDRLKTMFDCVIALNVLEHVPNHVQALMNIKRLLKPGGIAVVLVPAHKWAYGTIDENLGHCRRYEPDELKALLLSIGFKIQLIRHYNILGVFGWWWNSRILKRKILPINQVKLFDTVFWPIFKLETLFSLPFGLSLICIGEKPV